MPNVTSLPRPNMALLIRAGLVAPPGEVLPVSRFKVRPQPVVHNFAPVPLKNPERIVEEPKKVNSWSRRCSDGQVHSLWWIKRHGSAKDRKLLKQFTRDERLARHLCLQCEKPAAYFGDVGGYGIHCEACAKIKAEQQRAARAEHKRLGVPSPH